jgi:Golgi phosphoprotein 3
VITIGETWNVMKIGYQLKQVRERLAKGLVDKGVLRTEKRNFLLFDMATHPVADPAVKEEIIKRVCTMLVTRVSPASVDAQSDVPHAYVRTVSMICAAYAANVLENALLYLQPDLREQAFNKVDELMNDYSSWPFTSSNGKVEIPSGTDLSLEVVASVLNVLAKMDAIVSCVCIIFFSFILTKLTFFFSFCSCKSVKQFHYIFIFAIPFFLYSLDLSPTSLILYLLCHRIYTS